MPRAGGEMSAEAPPVAQPTDFSSVPRGKLSIKRNPGSTIPLGTATTEDPEILEDSNPIGTYSNVNLPPGGSTRVTATLTDVFSGMGIGGVSFGTIILVILTAVVGYLLIRKGK